MSLHRPVCLLDQRDEYGRPIILFKFSNVKPDSSPCIFQDGMTTLKILFEVLGEVEEFLIRGIVLILDISGMGLNYLKVAPVEDVVKILKNGEKCVAMRMKGVHIVNVPPVLSFAYNLIMKHAQPKMRERIRFYKNFDEVDFIDKKHLPKEYGGTRPMAELLGECEENL